MNLPVVQILVRVANNQMKTLMIEWRKVSREVYYDVSDSVLSQTVVRLQVADLSARLAKGKLVNIPIAARFT